MKATRRATKSELVATWVMVGCAVALTGVVIGREFGAVGGANGGVALSDPTSPKARDDWEQFTEEGISLGYDGAPVTIIEFADFKCGFCGELAPILKEIRGEYGATIRFIYRHYAGASGHPEAVAAAKASECAARFNVFEQFHDELYERPELKGEDEYGDLFQEVGGEDVGGFLACTRSTWVEDRLAADLAAAATLGIEGTPTLMINGEMVVGLVPKDTIVSMVSRALGTD